MNEYNTKPNMSLMNYNKKENYNFISNNLMYNKVRLVRYSCRFDP